MADPEEFDLDKETSRAWRDMAADLGDDLAALHDRARITIAASADADGRPTRSGGDFAAIVFSVTPDGQLRRVTHLADGSVGERETAPQREADRLAADTVRVLRDVHDVMHPVFVTISREIEGVMVKAASRVPPVGTDDLPVLIDPVDAKHLLDVAHATIVRDLDLRPDRDVDGDLIVETGSIRLFIRALEGAPVIQIFGRLVHDVGDARRAAALVASLNNDYPFVKFSFAEDAVFGCVHLPSSPFVPAQLTHLLVTFAALADDLDDELARRLGGSREIEPVPSPHACDVESPTGMPPELMTLVRLDPHGDGLEPERTAEVCGYDRGLARQLLHIALGQHEVWRAAAESTDDPDHEARCRDEAAAWQATRRSLAQALELIDAREGQV